MKTPASEFVGGVGEEWTFDYPVEIVKLAWNVWRNSQYAHIPTFEEIAAHDPRWVSDLMLMDQLHRWVNPPEQKAAPGGDGAAFKFGDINIPLP